MSEMKTNGSDSAYSKTSGVNLDDRSSGFGEIFCEGGLTKREYFAALAMQGLCSEKKQDVFLISAMAKWSVQSADALIAALNEGKE